MAEECGAAQVGQENVLEQVFLQRVAVGEVCNALSFGHQGHHLLSRTKSTRTTASNIPSG